MPRDDDTWGPEHTTDVDGGVEVRHGRRWVTPSAPADRPQAKGLDRPDQGVRVPGVPGTSPPVMPGTSPSKATPPAWVTAI